MARQGDAQQLCQEQSPGGFDTLIVCENTYDPQAESPAVCPCSVHPTACPYYMCPMPNARPALSLMIIGMMQQGWYIPVVY